ncbi:hypothetical protein EVB94_014 [Rhizobium phage RHph_TM40]|nr:hypothetical protein EVB94_014 [Rhizobium phage RHph_TM40]QIG71848.1 hypothetical protein EVB95_014 [Rhizobium phage RHph_TM2_3B]QIG72210.1 hypothetical protein EVB96_014 [Rhizobium phage RHph_TM3_3_6]
MSMAIDHYLPMRYTNAFWYTEGSILHFGREYYRQYGFWRVESKILVRVDMEGNEIIPIETQKIPETPRGWHLVHAGTNRYPVQPLVIAHDKNALEKYLETPDEVVIERERLADEERARRQREYDEWYANASDLERRLRSFDWTYEMADRPPNLGPALQKMCDELEKLPYEEAKAIWNKYYVSKVGIMYFPDFRKCEGFKYPEVALISYSYKEHKLNNHEKWTLWRNGVEDVVREGTPRRYTHEIDRLGEALRHLLNTGIIRLDTPIFTEGRQWSTVGELSIFQKKDQAA